MHWREQGDRGEMAAAAWYAAQGGYVFWPLGHCRDYDFVVDLDGALRRVQVKTSGCEIRPARFQVTLATRGGNRSWSGHVKTLDASRFDELFVVLRDGRRWRLQAATVDGKKGIVLGGPKYAECEVTASAEFAWSARASLH
jgi:hypothetical protein